MLLFCCSEYLATFKKTVAMHEVFLQRLASHPILRKDNNYQVFLEFDGDVSNIIVQPCVSVQVYLCGVHLLEDCKG